MDPLGICLLRPHVLVLTCGGKLSALCDGFIAITVVSLPPPHKDRVYISGTIRSLQIALVAILLCDAAASNLPIASLCSR